MGTGAGRKRDASDFEAGFLPLGASEGAEQDQRSCAGCDVHPPPGEGTARPGAASGMEHGAAVAAWILLLAIAAYPAAVSGQGKRPPVPATRAALSTLGAAEGNRARVGGCGAASVERSGDPRSGERSAAFLLAEERGRTGFGDSSPHCDLAFVPTGISPDSKHILGWNLENEGLPRESTDFFWLGRAGRSSTQLPSAAFHLQRPAGAGDPIPSRAPGRWPEPPSISGETPSLGDPHETASHDTDRLRAQIRLGGGIGRESG